MDYTVYIIRQNTPESKLLSDAGIDRSKLQVSKWKGKRQSKGGFGRSPIEWRINNTLDVEKLCNTIVRILGNRKTLTNIEIQAFERAKTTINGISNARLSLKRSFDLIELRKITIGNFLKLKYPSLSIDMIDTLISFLSTKSYNSLNEMLQDAKKEMKELIPIENAQSIFKKIMKIE
jgi:hypothetical protein